MHGDFLAEARGKEGRLIGGLALLSGYLHQVRKEEENVLYVIAGDMLQGSIIDSEYKGISTMEIMNYLAPDVVTLGNHELDYGLPHLLFLEKMANFPILNANLYIRQYHKRLMQPYCIINRAGLDILFIGIITEMVMNQIKMDSDIGTFISLEEACAEVGKICNAYKNEDIDLTVLVTHVGFEADKQLAAMLDPGWGVDMIIGGHSHTVLEQPVRVNDVLIVQAGVGTDQIGRFDIVVDNDTNRIAESTWRLVPIDDDLAKPDKELQKYIDSYREAVDSKYKTIICRFVRKLTHPRREEETALGNLFADIAAERAQVDVAFIGSGSIRAKELGPLVTLGDFRTAFPYEETLFKLAVTGAQLKQIMAHTLRPENRKGGGECHQVSRGVKAIYNTARRELESLTLHGQPVQDEQPYTISLQEYQFENSAKTLGQTNEALTALAGSQVVATSTRDVLEEYLRIHQNLDSRVEGRFEFRS
jgi:5'-nucleotidase